ncbi:SAV_2336 N-terminal domain-related protein [Kitasatospora sp. NBC_01539]|uniref:SAV_2336 N-terminal domain-related protein n=1 Tax=Kitasatospora sp. NBC_01539 TaxID=2903577 RepID=UPI003860201C
MNGGGPERLRSVLAAAGVGLTARELAEVLWLADRMGPAEARPGEAVEPGSVPPEAPAAAASEPPGRGTDDPPGPSTDVYAAAGRPDGGTATRPVLVRGERAVYGARRLVRALKPLKRPVPSPRDGEPDENATADLMADTGLPDLALRPRTERWLDLVLLVDDGLSMEIWRELADGLHTLLGGAGVFRRVRSHGLDTRHPAGPRLHHRPFGGPAGPAPHTVRPADGRGVVLVLSDTVGAAWRDGRMDPLLADWARRCPTAVLQPLPQRLWPGAGLPTETKLLQPAAPGRPNTAWRVEDLLLPADLAPFAGIPVPVLECDPAALAAFAGLIAGTAPAVLRTAAAAAGPRPAPPAPRGEPAAPDMHARLTHFRAAASPEAFLLAGHLAAVRPLTLPVMRLVQRAVLPGRGTPAQLAEVLLGGLVRRAPGPAGPGGRGQRYDFRPGLRELLLDSVPARAALDTAALVGDLLERTVPQGGHVPALQADTAGTRALPPGAAAFAGTGSPLLARFAPAAGGPAGPVGDVPFGTLADHDPQLAAAVAGKRWREAVERGEQALEHLLADHGPDHPAVLGGRLDLAEWIGEAGAPQTARRLCRELLADLTGRLGPDHLRTLRLRARTGHWHGRSDDWRRAADTYRALLPDQERLLGPDHPDSLYSRHQLGFWTVYVDRAEALAVFTDLLVRQTRVLGPDHRETLRTRANIASQTGQGGDAAAALVLWQDLLTDLRRALGADDDLTVIAEAEIAHWLAATGDPAAALRTIPTLLPRITAAFGPGHPTPYGYRLRIAQWTGETGAPADAVRQLRELIGDLGAVLPPEHPIFLAARGDHAYWTARAGDRTGGLQRLRDLLPELDGILGADDPCTRRVRDAVAAFEREG